VKTVTGAAVKADLVNANKQIVETTQALIALYKREFGDHWQEAFRQSVSVVLADRLP
jgi:hypothetical protein